MTRRSTQEDLGVRVVAHAIGRRVELEVEIDNRRPDHRLRARFDLGPPPAQGWTLSTETAFGWLERTTPDTHPTAGVTVLAGAAGAAIAPTPAIALGGPGLHEVERHPGGVYLTLLRAVGRMSRADLSTRAGHAGYAVIVPDAQALGLVRQRYALAIGRDAAQAVRELDPALVPPRAVALADAVVRDQPCLWIEPADARLSIWKRAEDGRGEVVRIVGAPGKRVTARLRIARPVSRAWLSDLDERQALPEDLPAEGLAPADLQVEHDGDTSVIPVEIEADEVATVRFTLM